MAEAAGAVAALGLACNILQPSELWFKFVTTAWKFSQSKQEEVQVFKALETLGKNLREVAVHLDSLEPPGGVGADSGNASIEDSFRGALLGVLYNEESLTLEGPDVQRLQITPERRDQLQKKFLASLEFEWMHSREEMVGNVHESTFRWIFEGGKHGDQPRDSLAIWLASDDSLYWITRKAGAGKSTLMKFISMPTNDDNCDGQRTTEPRCMPFLREWSDSRPLAFASFYFWVAGTKLQTSQDGLFRTILHQLLGQYSNMISHLFPQHWAALCLFDQSTAEYTRAQLKTAFLTLVNKVTKVANLCLFVDALDELDGDHGNLIELLKSITQRQSVKICVASRPWLVFEESLKNKPSLRLEDLAFDDIKDYVASHFTNNPDFALLKRQEEKFSNALIDNVVRKASGVICGSNSLDTLPPDLDAFYERILDQLDPDYLENASQYFSLVAASNEPPSAILFSFADEEDTRFAIKLQASEDLLVEIWRLANLRDRMEYLGKRLNSRSKGLIEMDRIPVIDEATYTTRLGDTCNALQEPKVHYLHKTVKDYLEKPDVRQEASGAYQYSRAPMGGRLLHVQVPEALHLEGWLVMKVGDMGWICMKEAVGPLSQKTCILSNHDQAQRRPLVE
ncbi:hypothetical protein QBC38DRAFT_459137 [Podospora fimiseda]|uniref:NACHT domain-containing protein n=1 Tax=Podospora fimiseda TaxID=252190 RepID=A0AAN7BI25_9PEZI|nr:hypothetical protein QBC38DRAFT_459137 [Podospora fimiseda]